MKKILLFFLSLGFVLSSNAQINEIEPNDTLTQATNLPIGVTVTGQTCMWNNLDYYQIILPEDGLLRVHSSVAGEGINPIGGGFTLTLFNHQNGWNGFTPLAGENGASLSDVSEWCCLEADTFYLQVYRGYAFNYCFDYSLSWEIVNAPFLNDNEPNSTFNTAEFLLFNTPTEGHSSFINHPQGGGMDNTDFFSFVPPVNGTLRLYLEVQAQSSGSNSLTVNLHNHNGSSWYAQQTSVPSYPAISSDTLTWECMSMDTMFFSIVTTNFYDRGYSYRIRYDMLPMVFANDGEPNDFFPSAQLIDPSLPIEGNQLLGNSGFWNGTQEDIFKFYKPDTGFFKIVAYSETHTDNPTAGNVIQLYDHNANPIGAPFAAPIGIHSVPAVDSIYFASLPADTLYIKTYSPYAFASCRSYRLELSYYQAPQGTQDLSVTNISLFPNPNNGIFTLDTRKLTGFGQVQILDFLGRKVYDERVVLGTTIPIHLQEMANGCYLVRIANKEIDIRKSFVVNH
jgi:hypothetical protein